MSMDNSLPSETRKLATTRMPVANALRFILPRFAIGQLRVDLPNGSLLASGEAAPGPEVKISVRKWRALARLAFGGELGFAKSFADGDWSTNDLGALFDLVMLNEDMLTPRTSPTWLARTLHQLDHHRNRNTPARSRRNIMAHYDLGNRFFAAWLDRGMNYSSALYREGNVSLEDAQEAKLKRVTELRLPKANERVLEIGSGWGSLSEHLARNIGCHVTAVTLSREQRSHMRIQMADLRASGRVDIRLQDYRKITGLFDHIVSLEMIEAVGEAYWPIFFSTLHDRLRAGGRIVLQAITICEGRFETYRRRPDFIQHFIFPGGMLPTKAHIRAHAERVGLTLVAQESFGESYARTLAEWRRRFNLAWPYLARHGFDERFYRLWNYYLAYCETGFRFKATDVSLFTLERR